MKRVVLLLALVCLPAAAFAQGGCAADPVTGGTQCTAPLKTVPQQNATPTTQIDFTPESAQFPCATLGVGANKVRLCAKVDATGNSQLFEDDGNGLGYHTLIGPPGPPGATGPQGAPGQAATIAIGTISGLPAGSTPNITNAGTASAAVFNFEIPVGQDGTNGTNGQNGAAATVNIGSVSTLPPGSPATVTNEGDLTDAVLDFGIPSGAPGVTLPLEMICDIVGMNFGATNPQVHVVCH